MKAATLQEDGSSPLSGGPFQDRAQGTSVDIVWRLYASKVHKGRKVVSIEDHLAGYIGPRRYPWTTHQEWHVYVFLVGALLSFRYAMLTFVPAVVGGEEDVGVAQLALVLELAYHPGHEIVERP